MNSTAPRNCSRTLHGCASDAGVKPATTRIKQAAHDLGFDLVGITTANPPPHAAEFHQWLADGFHGEMGYLARNAAKRIDPRQVLRGAKSVIVVGMNYATHPHPDPLPPDGRGETVSSPPSAGERIKVRGQVARYAQGARDYHDVMGEKLKELVALVDGVWYVDTGPVLERDLAQRAGIGWIGKHTNLISRRLGNWFFIGVVLTPLELTADVPEREYCGTCTRCITACPTNAIVAPYRLDARQCISYLTIELKGSIPVELRPAIGDRVFGCDDCLEVCPWNRFARPAITPRELPALTEMLGWTEQQFIDYFRGTPIYRLKRTRWLRNICVVLGNLRNPVVKRALDDPDPLVREHAAWAVEQLRAG